jgi:hypothetical protein
MVQSSGFCSSLVHIPAGKEGEEVLLNTREEVNISKLMYNRKQ